MEKIVNRQEAEEFLRPLIGQALRYALKSPDTELYDFGFGKPVEVTRLGWTWATAASYGQRMKTAKNRGDSSLPTQMFPIWSRPTPGWN